VPRRSLSARAMLTVLSVRQLWNLDHTEMWPALSLDDDDPYDDGLPLLPQQEQIAREYFARSLLRHLGSALTIFPTRREVQVTGSTK
jgi:hypothetical protein